MIYEPLLDCHAADWSDPEWPAKINNAVESNSTHVWFNLAVPYPPMIFMQVIAQSWASILPNEWAYDHNCWPGEAHPEEHPYTNETMFQYYDPEVSPLDDWPKGTGGRVECGSGPYTLEVFDATGHKWKLGRFTDYWGTWPAPGIADDYLETVTFYGIDEWGTRKTMFLAGDADYCYVPRAHIPELVTNWDENPSWEEEIYPSGIDCTPGLPTLVESNVFPNFNISTVGNTHIGEPPYDELHEKGLPYWFFSDVNVRKAFAYSFNWTEYIQDVFLGEAKQPATPHVEGLAYDEYVWDVMDPDLDPDAPDTLLAPPYSQPAMPNGTVLPPVPKYYCNLTKAEELFKTAYGGDLWDKGFTFDLLYNTGNEARETAALMLEESVEAMNPRFHINVVEVDWPTYLDELVAKRLTLFIIGWLADYPDPHNWYYPYMHSHGTFSYFQSYANPEVDELVERGVATTEDNERIAIYWKLGNKYFEDAVSIPLVQATGRHWERDWMSGWYYNPIYPGAYFYHLWKEEPATWRPVDLSATDSVEPTTPKYSCVQVFPEGTKMMRDGELVTDMIFNFTAKRLDTNPPAIVYAVAYFNRTGQQTNKTVLKYSKYIALGQNDGAPGGADEWTGTFNWTEDGSVPEECIQADEWLASFGIRVATGTEYDLDLANNLISLDSTVEAKFEPTDIDGSGYIDIRDIARAAKAFGSYPGHDRWDAAADIDGSGKVDIRDIAKIAKHFGITVCP